MTDIAFIGSVTVDEILVADQLLALASTVTVSRRNGAAACGGAPLYTGRPLVAAGHNVAPVLAIGDDSAGAILLDSLRGAGFDEAAVARHEAALSPRCLFIQQPSGPELCLYDPGTCKPTGLTPTQRAVIEGASLVILAAAPAAMVVETLKIVRPDQQVAWIFKDDPHCFPPSIRATIMARVTIIFCNDSERALIDPLRACLREGGVLFTTLGSAGVEISAKGQRTCLPTTPLAVTNTIGAGDTFAGFGLAALLNGADAIEAAAMGLSGVTEFLRLREHQR